MASALCNVNETDPQVYEGMSTVLGQIATVASADRSVRCAAFELLGHLVKIAPAAAMRDIDGWIKNLADWFDGEDDDFNQAVAQFIENTVKVLPISFKVYCGRIVPLLLRLLEKEAVVSATEEEDGDNAESSAQCIGRMRQAVLLAIAILISELPEEMSPFVDPFLGALGHYWESNDEDIQKAAAKCVLLMCDGLGVIGGSKPLDLLGLVVESLHDVCDLNLACELLTSLGTLLATFPKLINPEISEKIMVLFREFLSGKVRAVMAKRALDPEILQPLFLAIRLFAISSGGSHARELFDTCARIKNDHKKRMIERSFAVHTMCVISMVKPECSRAAAESCLNMLNNASSEIVMNILLNALSYVLAGNPSVLQPGELAVLLETLKGMVQQDTTRNEMLFGTASTLYFTICSIVGCDVNELMGVLNRVKFVVDDDDIPFIARFLSRAIEAWPQVVATRMKDMLVAIFGSGRWVLNLVPGDVLVQLSAFVKEIPDEEMWELVGWNQHQFVQIMRNVGKLV
jgi:hypothetical protein